MILKFGKYTGQTIDSIYKINESYINWLVKQSWFKKNHSQEYKYCIQCIHKPLEITIDPNTIIIYTDGACSNNGSKFAKAGIGIHFSKRNKIKFDDVSESLEATDNKLTNQRAELYAILKALRITKEVTNHIIIFTDSEYSINCVVRWFASWVSKNKVDEKKNVDLIRPIHQYYISNNFEFRHIKSHTSLQDEHSLGNEMADKLATTCIS